MLNLSAEYFSVSTYVNLESNRIREYLGVWVQEDTSQGHKLCKCQYLHIRAVLYSCSSLSNMELGLNGSKNQLVHIYLGRIPVSYLLGVDVSKTEIWI